MRNFGHYFPLTQRFPLSILRLRTEIEVTDTTPENDPAPATSASTASSTPDDPDPSSRSSPQPQPHLQFLGWAPQGNAFVFVYRNNVYYKPSVRSPKVYPISTDGVANVVFNGVPDWVYEGKFFSNDSFFDLIFIIPKSGVMGGLRNKMTVWYESANRLNQAKLNLVISHS